MNLNIDFYDAYSKVFNRICCYITKVSQVKIHKRDLT